MPAASPLPSLRDRFLRDRRAIVAPSLLSADFSALRGELDKVRKAGCAWLHLDVMDGHFVDNITFGPPLVMALRPHGDGLFFDAHLMISEPMRYARPFVEAGAELVTFHAEAHRDMRGAIDALHELGVYAGISIRPKTPAEEIFHALPVVDLVLVMTVEPGFGGQKLIPACLDKVRRLAERRTADGHRFLLQVDGGIDATTTGAAVRAGAEVLVAGSAVFGGGRPVARNVQALREAAAE